MHKLYKLKEELCKSLESYADEGVNGNNIHDIDTLAHAAKNVCKLIEESEREAYSMRGYSGDGSYDSRSYDGRSYRGSSYDGRSMESRWEPPRDQYSQRRDSMGRYARDDGKHQKVLSELRELQRMSNNELDKEKYDSLIHLVESM